ncbi:phosphomannomutase/phosphoglucomutase [Campylobacter concisus]|uniref:phosphomannomutase/phosphoglucomutase n=1 Tax=Campylobacter concisus TaxID=199 RepID=UPI00122C9B0A|nr:phosphomannomutase/phosphoglucomutase [Campylobacter concisus]
MKYDEIFREYDIRGIFEKDLTEDSVKAIGLALGKKFNEFGVKTLSVGFDARLSARMLFRYLLSGLNKAGGFKIYNIGLLPTPVGYFSVYSDYFDANIMITGSHNPKEYNGFKITIKKDSFFGKDLQILKDKVNEIIASGEQIADDESCEKFNILEKYVEFFVKEFSELKNFKKPFVIDCANGAVGVSLVPIVKALGLNAKILYEDPDGNFPNHHPDPSEEKNLSDLKAALKGEFDIGFGFDGDGDRIAVLTKKRNIKGDELAYLYSLAMKNPRVLGEVKCSQNMYDEIDAHGGKSFMGKTGHSNIKKAMKELNIDMAAEVSGHIFFKERYFGFDDATYAMFRTLELVAKGFNLDGELDKLPKVFSTDEIKIKTTDAQKFKLVAKLKEILVENYENGDAQNLLEGLGKIAEIIDIDGIRVRFDDGSWALVRASNTTPVIVTRFEAKDEEMLNKIQNKISKILMDVIY